MCAPVIYTYDAKHSTKNQKWHRTCKNTAKAACKDFYCKAHKCSLTVYIRLKKHSKEPCSWNENTTTTKRLRTLSKDKLG